MLSPPRFRLSRIVKSSAWAMTLLCVSGWFADASAFSTTRVATGLVRPVFAVAPPGDFGRLFIVEQHTGRIKILDLGSDTLLQTPFLDIDGISNGWEQGLLGLAFHPDYAANGLFYVYVTVPATQILRFKVSADPNIADATSELLILEFSQPSGNHNGGWIGFGPDDQLYIATGDGGGGNDTGPGHTTGIGNAQDITENLLGKILRLDVDGDDFPADASRNYAIPADNPFVGIAGDDEIWAYGLRNPYRASFDRLTGDLYIGDVGQDACEEIDLQLASSSGGENYGWRLREGVIATPVQGIGGPAPAGAIDPVMDYPQSMPSANCSAPGGGFRGNVVTGGNVYRGPIVELQGRYFFSDFGTGGVWSFIWDGSPPTSFDGTNYTDLTDHTNEPGFIPDMGALNSISSFGEDAAGNLYLTSLFTGELYRVPEPNVWMMQVAGLLTIVGIVRIRARRGATLGRAVRASLSSRDAPRP